MRNASVRQAPETHPGMWSPPTTKRTLGSSYPELSSTRSKDSKWLFQKRAQNVGRNCCRSASNSQNEICARALKVAIKERAMYTNILIPTDGSELAEKAVQHGIALAKRIGAKVTVLTVLPPFRTFTTDTKVIEDTPAQYKARMHEHAEKTLGTAAAAAQTAGVACETVQVEHEHPYQAIIDAAVSKGCDLIVMAS